MNVKKRKSRKQSAANSKRLLEQIVLYLDRNLGKHIIANTLRYSNVEVEIHDDHLPINAPDEHWIELVGRRNWIAITKDKNIRYRTAEIEAIKKYNARVIVIRAKNATGSDLAELILKSMKRITQFAKKTKAPFIAGIDRSGRVTAYRI